MHGYAGQSDVERRKHKTSPVCERNEDHAFPGSTLLAFCESESFDCTSDHKCLETARRVACYLAMYNLPGFRVVLSYLEEHRAPGLRFCRIQHDYQACDPDPRLLNRVRDAFTIIADTGIIPAVARKAASRFGGVRPGKDGEGPRNHNDDWSEWADPGDDVYNSLMQEVLGQTNNTPPHHTRQAGFDNLRQLSPEECGEVIKAYLAAADAAVKLEEHILQPTMAWHREYKPFPGGVYNETDEVADYINRWIRRHFHDNGILPYKKFRKKAVAESRVS